MYVSFYSTVYYNFLFLHMEIRMPTWREKRAWVGNLSGSRPASFGSRHGIRHPFMSLKQLTTVFGGKQSISSVPLAFRNPKFYIRFAFYKPGPRSVLEPPSQTFVVIRIFHVGVGKLPAEGRQKPQFHFKLRLPCLTKWIGEVGNTYQRGLEGYTLEV